MKQPLFTTCGRQRGVPPVMNVFLVALWGELQELDVIRCDEEL